MKENEFFNSLDESSKKWLQNLNKLLRGERGGMIGNNINGNIEVNNINININMNNNNNMNMGMQMDLNNNPNIKNNMSMNPNMMMLNQMNLQQGQSYMMPNNLAILIFQCIMNPILIMVFIWEIRIQIMDIII